MKPPALTATERTGTALFGALLAALGLFIGHETLTVIPASPSYAALGPRAFPGLIGLALVGVGATLLGQARRAGVDASPDRPRHDWAAVGRILAALAAQIVLLPWLGWIPAATLVFVGVAGAFGSRRRGRDLLIGLVLATATFVLFRHGLGLDLPAGRLIG